MEAVTINEEQPEQCNQRCSESDGGPWNEESDNTTDTDPGETSGLLTKKRLSQQYGVSLDLLIKATCKEN